MVVPAFLTGDTLCIMHQWDFIWVKGHCNGNQNGQDEEDRADYTVSITGLAVNCMKLLVQENMLWKSSDCVTVK